MFAQQVLVHNRFLGGVQFVELMKYYGDLVGIEFWQNRSATNHQT